jgi:CheY-like chemotaxis protein
MPKKILLADDSITIQKVVELTFSDGDYEVTAVNNGAKAIQKLSEMRPDIILSDIIMPEKNGYEVCEYVKSHPEFRNIPVILLTGTFEPFDPDRADKAGCDAVVTKPFESQSLIHKVEELVQQSQHAAAEPEPAPPALFAEPSFEVPAAPAAEPFAHDNDIFAASPGSSPTLATEMPFDSPSEAAFGGETRAFPRMSFEEMQQMAKERTPQAEPAAAPPEAPAVEASPWDETPAAFGDDTHALHPSMSFAEPAPETPQAAPDTSSPFDMAPPPAHEASPWDEPQESDNATRAIPAMSFEEMRRMAEAAQPEPAPFEAPPAAPAPESSPWDEQPAAFGGETRAFPRMSFEEMEKIAAAPQTAEPAWPATEEMNTSDPFAEPMHTESPFAAEEMPSATAAEPEWSIPAAVEEPAAPEASSHASAEPHAAEASAPAGELTDEQVDRIARRVVQLMSDQVVRNIAWEVIPDLAEMVVKERIRQLEAEA